MQRHQLVVFLATNLLQSGILLLHVLGRVPDLHHGFVQKLLAKQQILHAKLSQHEVLPDGRVQNPIVQHTPDGNLRNVRNKLVQLFVVPLTYDRVRIDGS
uniref:(northern house mosquito) hypothetical protein n=1 Tax=Culex pipiens TaxID=7175 RepID=A0A8D8CEQ0_CULPI